MASQSSLCIKDIHIDCFIGLAKHERVTPQDLCLDLRIDFDSTLVAESDQIADTIDYVRIVGEMVFILESSHFYLIETAGHALSHYLCYILNKRYPQIKVHEFELSITKPHAIKGLAVPSFSHKERMTEGDKKALFFKTKNYQLMSFLNEEVLSKDSYSFGLMCFERGGVEGLGEGESIISVNNNKKINTSLQVKDESVLVVLSSYELRISPRETKKNHYEKVIKTYLT